MDKIGVLLVGVTLGVIVGVALTLVLGGFLLGAPVVTHVQTEIVELTRTIVTESTVTETGMGAPYSYNNWNFSTLPEDDVSDIEVDDKYIWILGVTTDRIYRYRKDGLYDNCSIVLHVPGETYGLGPLGLDFNGTHFFVSCGVNKKVYAFLGDGTSFEFFEGYVGVYANFSFDVSRQVELPHALVFNGTYFWVGDAETGRIHRYLANGTYDNWSIDTGKTGLLGLEFNGEYFWTMAGNVIYRYRADGTYEGWHLDTSEQDTLMEGVAFDGTYFYAIGNDNDMVYRYSAYP